MIMIIMIMIIMTIEILIMIIIIITIDIMIVIMIILTTEIMRMRIININDSNISRNSSSNRVIVKAMILRAEILEMIIVRNNLNPWWMG